MKTSFTPGPWIHELDDGANITCTDGYAICDMAYEYSSIPRAELEANARLITSAPESLVMLEECAVHIAAIRGDSDPYAIRAFALIAKATGAEA